MLDLSTTTSSRNIGSNLRLKRNTPVRRNNKSLFDTMNIRRKEHDGGVNEVIGIYWPSRLGHVKKKMYIHDINNIDLNCK